MSRFMRGLFQTARTISTIDPTALTGTPGGPSPQPRLERLFDGTNVRSYSCTHARYCVVLLIIYIYLAQYFLSVFWYLA